MQPLRRALLTLSLSALSVGTVACQGAMSEDDALVGEAAASLTVAEETGEPGSEATAGESDAVLQDAAMEAAEVPALPEEASGVCDLEGRRQRVLARYDDDGDGRLGPAERRDLKRDLEARVGHPLAVRFGLRHRALVMKRVKWAFDEDGDGVLSTLERTALVDALEARCLRLRAKALERFDANGNGVLDGAERDVAKAALREKVAAMKEQTLAKYDANGNSALDDGEKLALRADLVAAWKATRAEVVKAFDVNGSGRLEEAEELSLKRAMQQRLAEGRDAS